jgi:hypothetical protein
VVGQRPRAVGGPAYRESTNQYSHGRRIGEIPRGNPDAKSEPSIRWDMCQEYGGSQGSTDREFKRAITQCNKNPDFAIYKIAMKSEPSDQALIWTVNSSQYRGLGL